ncbi:ABC transporter permease [Iodobacter arcticus]|uniref:ABC transporter permease n=1 Tax=Iodobacter arcticus TaxID=590593 RepID=A0ABW2QU64_9NEIS
MMIWEIFKKEWVDSLRDKRTMLVVILSSLMGMPFFLFISSEAYSRMDEQNEKRFIRVVGAQYAPELINYIARQGFEIKTAGADYANKLHSKEYTEPVLLLPKNFASQYAAGIAPRVEIVSDLANKDTQMGVRPIKVLLQGFMQEQAGLNLSLRGISAEILSVLKVEERHLSRAQNQQGAGLKEMLPFMFIMTLLGVGMYAAIDTSAGERERGSLEPLMMNPVSSWHFALGKWAAVGTLTVCVLFFNVMSIFPSLFLIKNEVLKIAFQFSIKDAFVFLAVLCPLALAIAALQIAVAINGKSHKEAQARNSMLMLLAPLALVIGMLKQGADPVWFSWTPLLAQNQLIIKILNGETLSAAEVLTPVLVCVVILLASLSYTAQKMRRVVMQ